MSRPNTRTVDQDTAITTYPDVSVRRELRRARLGVEGVVCYDVKYILEVDFANDVVAVKDAYLQYQGVEDRRHAAATSASAISERSTRLKMQTSELFVDTVERAAFVTSWHLDRQIGFGISYWTDHLGLAAGIFGDGFRRPAILAAVSGLHRG